MAYWGPILKPNAPKSVIVPQPLHSDNIHAWIADNQTTASRAHWQQMLAGITALKPRAALGHFLPSAPQTLASVTFTQNYLNTLEAELPKAKDF